MNILGIGITVLDQAIQIPHYPVADSKTTILRHRRQVGGPVPTALSTATFYGAETILLSRWGEDPAGKQIQEELTGRGVDISLCKTDPRWETGFAHVWLDASDGSRTLASFRGDFPPLSAEDIDQPGMLSCLAEANILHLDGSYPEAARRAAEIAKKNGSTVVLDAGSSKPGMEHLFPLIDILIASSLFRQSHFGTSQVAPEQLRDLGPPTVITTDGRLGASVYTTDHQFHEPAIEIEAVDTNGAGDIFSGAVLFALSQQWSLHQTIRFANQVAGYSCGQHGNHSLPDRSTMNSIAK